MKAHPLKMRFEIKNKASLLLGFKACPILAKSDISMSILFAFATQGLKWNEPLHRAIPHVSFYELRNSVSFLLDIIQENGVSAVHNANLTFTQMQDLSFTFPKDFDPKVLQSLFSDVFSHLTVSCDNSPQMSNTVMDYSESLNRITIFTDPLSHETFTPNLFPIWLLHEFCHILEPCKFEKALQTNFLKRPVNQDELQIAAHCARFKFVLLTLSLNAHFIRQDLFDQVLASLQPTTLADLTNFATDPYSWETQIHDSFVQDTFSNRIDSRIHPFKIKGATSLEDAKTKFFSRPNFSRNESQTSNDIEFEAKIINLAQEKNLLKLASSKYALNLLTDIYVSKIPLRKSIFKTTLPALIATYDHELNTICFFYTDGASDFFEVTPMEAFWILDFFQK